MFIINFTFWCILVNQYVIEVETGDEEGAETSEVIHVNLFGTLGDSGKRYLIHNTEKRSKFQRGQVRTVQYGIMIDWSVVVKCGAALIICISE